CYAYEDVISLIVSRYDDLYSKVTHPSIYMPTVDRESESLGGESLTRTEAFTKALRMQKLITQTICLDRTCKLSLPKSTTLKNTIYLRMQTVKKSAGCMPEM